ncbi:heterokaryon incompatibility protein-domain-containing protein [Paraphoma chrysanthemicola]|nr:heterokaryon incompatibility protein-domain-containing protein [Paraphoma chrysanthemicola]
MRGSMWKREEKLGRGFGGGSYCRSDHCQSCCLMMDQYSYQIPYNVAFCQLYSPQHLILHIPPGSWKGLFVESVPPWRGRGMMANCCDATSGATHTLTRFVSPPHETSRTMRLLLASDTIPITMRPLGWCQICVNLAWYYEQGKTCSIHFQISFERLREGSNSGCIYCTIMCITRRLYAPEMPDGINNVCVHSDHMSSNSPRFCLRWPESGREEAWLGDHDNRDIQIHISLCPQADPWDRFQRRQSIPSSARSSETVSFCKDKLQECIATHEKCHRGHGWLPTRLLFLGDGLRAIRLIETCNLETRHYAALSHPWGVFRNIKLESSNEASMKQLIPWDTLPRTYHDTFWFCRRLRIDYLWIDSVCIRQDDSQDWNFEAAKMADVYENALLVIAASSCRSTQDSFLNPRTPAQCGPIVVAWSDNYESKPTLQVQKIPKTGFHLPRGMDTTDPLDERAWAFQEKMLACRLINFTNGDVQWSCKSACFCECPKEWKNWPRMEGHDIPATTQEWKNAISDYSGLSLTYLSDRLPALSGLATRFHQNCNAKYLAGLWYNDEFIEQLLWCKEAKKVNTGQVDCQAYRAPTFSWASINAKVRWCHSAGYMHAYITVDDAKCTPKTENPFGEVSDGYIKVRGRRVRLFLQQPATKQAQPAFISANGQRLSLLFYLDIPTGYTYFRKFGIHDQNEVRLQRSMQWLTEEAGNLPQYIPISVLRICACGPYKSDIFMVLVESFHVPGTYERLGLIWTWGGLVRDAEKESLGHLLKCWESSPIEEITIV